MYFSVGVMEEFNFNFPTFKSRNYNEKPLCAKNAQLYLCH